MEVLLADLDISKCKTFAEKVDHVFLHQDDSFFEPSSAALRPDHDAEIRDNQNDYDNNKLGRLC